MDNKKVLILINPKSGTRSRRGLPEAVLRVFGNSAHIVYTEYPGHATELARSASASGYSKVVAIGGDGTINETATGLIGSTIPLAIVPFGSGNGLARHLGIPMKRDAALQVAASGTPLQCDCGKVEDRHFFCTMGVGFDAKVSHEFAMSKRRGLLSYSRIAVNNLMRYTPEDYHIEVDGVPSDYKAFIVAVCNASQYGNNAFIAPHASMADGVLDVTIIERGGYARLAEAGVRLFTHSLDRSPLIHTLRGSDIRITRKAPGPGHIDGEAATMPADIHIHCLRAALSVIVPPCLKAKSIAETQKINPLTPPPHDKINNIAPSADSK